MISDKRLLFMPAILVAVSDLGSKSIAEAILTARTIEILPVLSLALGHNTGVSFGMLADSHPWITLAVSSAALALILVAGFALRSGLEKVALGLIIGGGAANLADRLMDGAVTDFISLHAGQWRLPTFNLADVAITVGAALLIASFVTMHGSTDPKEQ